ncbi:TPA: hypothetical protein ACJ6XF_001888 [Legionella pneumophila]|nr:hypothetical protein [Legionella pneumophila]
MFYNAKEHGYFRINCDLPVSNTMSCKVEQLWFVDEDIQKGSCHISWSSPHVEIFTYNFKNATWVNVRKQNNECGLVNFSSLYKKNGDWIYRFGTHVLFKNSKTEQLGASCKAFENSGVEYTSRFEYIKLNCNSFTLLPF